MFVVPYLIEILTPRRAVPDRFEEQMNLFADKYRRIMDSGCGVTIPDNPMGQPRYSALESIGFNELGIDPEKIVLNLNTFHTKEELNGYLNAAAEMGIRYLLVIRGDGGPRLPKLDPASIGGTKSIATSIDLIRYINSEYAGMFITGAAFNQYNPISFETDRLEQKIDAGAKFVITQPVIANDSNVDLLEKYKTTVVIEAWMSSNVDLLYKSVRRPKDERAQGFDPHENLKMLHDTYPDSCIYLSMLSFKQAWSGVLPKL